MNIKNKKAMHVHEKEYIRKHFFSFFAKGNVLFIHGYNST
jgi:hypothetical protein